MSRENVEVVRRIFEAAARRDVEAVLSLYDPEIEFDNTRAPHGGLMTRGVFRGHGGLRAFYSEYMEAWESVTEDLEELIDAGEHVISIQTTRARGRASGAEVETPHMPGVWTVRDGKVIHVAWLATRQEAFEAAGLQE
jgi:ketosteroid isomerase-like protein